MEKIKEDKKTRKIVWLCDMCGNTGKSIFTDILEEHPKYECLTLMIDSYRSFKYTSARLISNYIDKKGKPPKAFLIDAPRDEESKYLHEIYGVQIRRLAVIDFTSYYMLIANLIKALKAGKLPKN